MSRIAFVGLGAMGRPMAKNLLAAGHELTVASRSPEPVAALEAAGARAGTLSIMVGGGLAANKVMEVRRENLLSGEFPPGFRIDLHHKDLGIALAAEHGVDLPATPLVRDQMQTLREAGRGGEDHTALLAAVRQGS